MCKGCKAECPSNVDVAKLKVEFLGHYYTAHTPSLGTRMLANTGWINRIGSALAPISNWLGLVGGGLREWLTGIDRRRPLPRFVRQNFARWFDRHQPANGAGTRGRVVLLDDCLTSYCEPGVNRSAVELLEAAGYQVERANLWCCGRPFISKGLLDQAKSLVRRNVAILDEYARENIPILGVEPSCLLTLVDEYPDLFPSEATQRVRQQAQLLDGWLASRVKSGEARLEFQSREGQVLLHGHCQQKALVGTGGTRQALGLIPGLSVKEVDSGCCGMAGSFGYEHYDVSQQIGERVLFPAVRAHASQTGTGPVCAPGFSCRHQVLDGTGQRPLHPVELLREQLVKPEDH